MSALPFLAKAFINAPADRRNRKPGSREFLWRCFPFAGRRGWCRRGVGRRRGRRRFRLVCVARRSSTAGLRGRGAGRVWDTVGKKTNSKRTAPAEKLVQLIDGVSYLATLGFDAPGESRWMSGHPPFGLQITLNRHEWIERQAHKQAICWNKQGNCFVGGSDLAGI